MRMIQQFMARNYCWFEGVCWNDLLNDKYKIIIKYKNICSTCACYISITILKSPKFLVCKGPAYGVGRRGVPRSMITLPTHAFQGFVRDEHVAMVFIQCAFSLCASRLRLSSFQVTKLVNFH